MPTAARSLVELPYAYCTRDDIDALLSVEGVDLRLDDDGDGTVEASEQALLDYTTLVGRGIHYATTRVNFYCQPRYAPADLQTSWLVNEWAAIVAARWVATRRGNPCPDSLQKLYDEAKEDMKAVKACWADLPDIGSRNVDWPAWSNMRTDDRYRLRKLRVERPLSEDTQTQYDQKKDWPAEYTFEI